jgi:hypothetical protein
MFAGQLACEALNFALKRIIKEERPKGMWARAGGIMPETTLTTIGSDRNVWKRLRNAIIPRTVCRILRCIYGFIPYVSPLAKPSE